MAPDRLLLDGSHALEVVPAEGGHRAEPVTLTDGVWARSVAGDGAGLALLHRLRNRSAVPEGFRVAAYAGGGIDDESERAMGVDQTHDSWVVGGRVVVKWLTQPLVGPHPAADRLRRLSAAGFAESPELVGLVEWCEPDTGLWVPVVIAQAYLPGTEDGWTWAVQDARRALGLVDGPAGSGFGSEVGDVVARLHLALADDPPALMGEELAEAHAAEALSALAQAMRVLEAHDPASYALLSEHRAPVEQELGKLAGATRTPVLPTHGDLHVGQLLRGTDRRYAVVDFDGNPTLPPHLRAAPAPAARDVADLLLSIENVEHVVRHYAPDLTDAAGRAWTAAEQTAFLESYRRGLGDRVDLYDESLAAAYDWEQVCRELVYVGEHAFWDWLHVPAGELRRRLVDFPA